QSPTHPTLHSFPTRRSSDLSQPPLTSPNLHQPPQPPLAVYYKECPSRGSHFRPNTTHTPWSARCTGAGSSAACSRPGPTRPSLPDRKSTRLNSSHVSISYAV